MTLPGEEKATALKPCPFCGTNATIERDFDADGFLDNIYVGCDLCFVYGADEENLHSIINNWNTRPVEDALREENRRLKEAMRNALYSLSGEAPPEFNNAEAILRNALNNGKEG